MGREVRRVPPGWEHPKEEERGRMDYKPLYDNDYKTVADEWLKNCREWDDGTHADLVRRPELKNEYPYFWDWDVSPPNEESYRPAWTEAEATAYQVYETVSEGTPVSPVFETLDALVAWLVSQGHSEHAARRFAETGWAPSMVMHRNGNSVKTAMGIDTHDLMSEA
jgi:hypothetical protein